MRTTTTRPGILLASALVLGAAASTAAIAPGAGAVSAPTWKSERGIVTECHGRAHGLRAYASVYENSRCGNSVQVVLGNPDKGNGNGRSTDDAFLVDGHLRAGVKVAGKRAVVKGTVTRVGARQHVEEQYDDGGQLIEVKGYHRALDTDLVLRYDGTRVPLTCDTAFFYNLKVKKTPIQ